MFVDEAFAASNEYKEFWAKLNRVEYEAKEYKRLSALRSMNMQASIEQNAA